MLKQLNKRVWSAVLASVLIVALMLVAATETIGNVSVAQSLTANFTFAVG